jgi:anti-sigma regulatory factor (Ser/Thr protein kinase)
LKKITQITEETFEQILHRFNNSSAINIQEVSFIDPYGMVGLLEIGEIFQTQDTRKPLYLPKSEEVLKYLERMDFFKIGLRYFEFERGEPNMSEKYLRISDSDVLLEITPIEKSDDIHFIVGRVKNRAHSILKKHLKYDERAINGFIVSLSEVCQNILEHSESKGFVGIQKYYFQNIEKNIVKIAVMDSGIGFRESLSKRFSLKSDLRSIEEAFIHGASRYTDEGRGHGLASVRRFVNQWNGKISIRSGTAKLSILPEWAWGKQREYNLTHFPGAQINILLPEI